MDVLRRIRDSRPFLWLLLAAPLVAMNAQYAAGDRVYGAFIHATGDLSAQILILTLAITPLRVMFPNHRWPIWLLQRRRYFGVAAFAYAVPHLGAYVARLGAERVAAEAWEPGMWTGWAAFVIFLALAATSNNWSMRRLGRRWKSLHRWVYLAATLTFAHWLLTAFDPLTGALHLLALAGLEGYRLWKLRAGSRPPPSSAEN